MLISQTNRNGVPFNLQCGIIMVSRFSLVFLRNIILIQYRNLYYHLKNLQTHPAHPTPAQRASIPSQVPLHPRPVNHPHQSPGTVRRLCGSSFVHRPSWASPRRPFVGIGCRRGILFGAALAFRGESVWRVGAFEEEAFLMRRRVEIRTFLTFEIPKFFH
jgi:hypothetical protein